MRGGVAESDGRLAPGDQIMKVNGEDMSHVTQEFAAAFLKVCQMAFLCNLCRHLWCVILSSIVFCVLRVPL